MPSDDLTPADALRVLVRDPRAPAATAALDQAGAGLRRLERCPCTTALTQMLDAAEDCRHAGTSSSPALRTAQGHVLRALLAPAAGSC